MLQGVNWVLTAVAIVLTAGRLALRLCNNRRLRSDDFTHLLALALLIIHGATNQVTLAAKAKQKVDMAPHSGVSSAELLSQYQHLHVLNTVNNVFLYAIMWIVKVAFLLLYRQVFNCSRNFIRVWWAVLAFTILSYIPPFAAVVHTCAGASTLAQYKACNSGGSFRNAKLIFTCVLNVVSDLMVMALPVWMISQLQMNVRQKIGLGFVFSIAILCVALDILRTVEAVAENQALYTVIEVNFSVIVFCLPTYRRLFADQAWSQIRKSIAGSSGHNSEIDSRKNSVESDDTATDLEYAMQVRPNKEETSPTKIVRSWLSRVRSR